MWGMAGVLGWPGGGWGRDGYFGVVWVAQYCGRFVFCIAFKHALCHMHAGGGTSLGATLRVVLMHMFLLSPVAATGGDTCTPSLAMSAAGLGVGVALGMGMHAPAQVAAGLVPKIPAHQMPAARTPLLHSVRRGGGICLSAGSKAHAAFCPLPRQYTKGLRPGSYCNVVVGMSRLLTAHTSLRDEQKHAGLLSKAADRSAVGESKYAIEAVVASGHKWSELHGMSLDEFQTKIKSFELHDCAAATLGLCCFIVEEALTRAVGPKAGAGRVRLQPLVTKLYGSAVWQLLHKHGFQTGEFSEFSVLRASSKLMSELEKLLQDRQNDSFGRHPL